MSDQKAPERAPMLSDESLNETEPGPWSSNMSGSGMAGRELVPKWTRFDVRNFYEDLIARGELVTKAECSKRVNDALEAERY